MSEVTITTGSRLHFGPLCVTAPAGGKFGGVGLMVDYPQIVLTACVAQADSVVADPSTSLRVAEFLQRIRNSGLCDAFPFCRITVSETIPAHCGFGSGTQLGLAVARAVSIMANEFNPMKETLAHRVGRGLRSAIGLHGFVNGGFLVDGGRTAPDRLGTLVSRADFPTEWRFVLAMPRKSSGLSGDAEQRAFSNQPPMTTDLTAELCRIVLMDWLPAVIESDFEQCSESLYTFGRAVGEFFTPTQGGVFAHPRMAEWAGLIRRRGIQGIAQTSWGPTLAALCHDATTAHQLQRDFSGETSWHDCSFEVVSPLNRGATIRRQIAGTHITEK